MLSDNLANHIWLTVAEAAAYLRVSQAYLNKLRVYGGSAPYSKAGKKVIYKRTDLDIWASERARNSTSDDGPQTKKLAR